MSKDKNENDIELFFPYYVNQERLLDIFAILNHGYSEFSEVSVSSKTEKNKKGKAEISLSGFKIFNFGLNGNTSGELGSNNSLEDHTTERKVQTVTSVLSKVKNELKIRGCIKNIIGAKAGDFVCLPVNLSINSMQSLMSELSDILKLSEEISKFGNQNKSSVSTNSKELERISKAMKKLFDGEEIVYETDTFAVFGNITESNLYQSVSADLSGAELTCLAQVKRVFPEGTELMRNTVFSKLNDAESKKKLINALSGFTNNKVYDFDAVVIPSIYGKPVYQLEIIALYQ